MLPVGARVLLPTGPDRHDRECCEWIRSPRSEHQIPTLSAVAAIALQEQERVETLDRRAAHLDILPVRGGVR